MTRSLFQIEAEMKRLRDERRAVKRKHFAPGHVRTRSFRPEGPGQRQPRERDNGYLAYLRRQPCRIARVSPGTCSGPIEACHVRYGDAARGKINPGLQRKPDDRYATSCCAGHHREQHAAGNERGWWAAYGLEGIDEAVAQYADYQGGRDAKLG